MYPIFRSKNSLAEYSNQGRNSDVEDDPFTERMPGSWLTEAMQHLTDRFGYLKYSSLKYSI
jgi:hypothetical protein